MTHVLILLFLGLTLAVGLYCLWVSLRVEFARVPRFLSMDDTHGYYSGLDRSAPKAHS